MSYSLREKVRLSIKAKQSNKNSIDAAKIEVKPPRMHTMSLKPTRDDRNDSPVTPLRDRVARLSGQLQSLQSSRSSQSSMNSEGVNSRKAMPPKPPAPSLPKQLPLAVPQKPSAKMASPDSIYGASARIGRMSTAKVLSPAELEGEINGYTLIHPDTWDTFDDGRVIKYIDNEGKFHKGGRVRGYYRKDGMTYIRIEPFVPRNVKQFAFTARLDRIAKIYLQLSPEYHILQREIALLREELDQIKQKIK